MTPEEAADVLGAALPWRLWEAAGADNELIQAARLVLNHARATAEPDPVNALPEPNHGPRWVETDDGEVRYRRWWVPGQGHMQDGYDVEQFGGDVRLGGEIVPDPRALAHALLAASGAAAVDRDPGTDREIESDPRWPDRRRWI